MNIKRYFQKKKEENNGDSIKIEYVDYCANPDNCMFRTGSKCNVDIDLACSRRVTAKKLVI